MMKPIGRMIALAALVGAVPAAAQRDTISIKDPAAFVAKLRELGYKPTALDTGGDNPKFDATFEDFVTTIRLVGCTDGKDCKYVTFVASYSDVIEPPAAWMAKMNDEFDLLKVGLNDKKQLYMFGAYLVEGMPAATFQQIVSYWIADTAAIGKQAQEDGHANKSK